MSRKISIEQWRDYLNKTTGGFNCPICGSNHWQTQPDNYGDVCDVELVDHSALYGIEEVIDDLFPASAPQPPTQPKKYDRPPSLLTHVIVIRCGHCGWVSLFDRQFVEDAIHGK